MNISGIDTQDAAEIGEFEGIFSTFRVLFEVPGQAAIAVCHRAEGARRLLAQAVEAEVAAFLAQHSSQVTGEGHQRVYVHTTSGTRSQRYRLNMINMLLM